jgi:hypothetical protein
MTQPEDDRLPAELEALDAALRAIELKPRASLGPEIAGRLAAGEGMRPAAGGGMPRPRVRVAAAAAVLILATSLMWGGLEPGPDLREETSTIDRCCQDLDGGGVADDGILVESIKGEKVSHLVVYEDQAHQGRWTPANVVRYERRGSSPAFRAPRPVAGMKVHQFCCGDYDGGTDHDDGVIVILSDSNDVLMAAVFTNESRTLENTILR